MFKMVTPQTDIRLESLSVTHPIGVDPIMSEDELRMRRREKPSPNCRCQSLKTELWKLGFCFLKS